MKTPPMKSGPTSPTAKQIDAEPTATTTGAAEAPQVYRQEPDDARLDEAMRVLRRRAKGTAGALRAAARFFDEVGNGSTKLAIPASKTTRRLIEDAAALASENLDDALASRAFFAMSGAASGGVA